MTPLTLEPIVSRKRRSPLALSELFISDPQIWCFFFLILFFFFRVCFRYKDLVVLTLEDKKKTSPEERCRSVLQKSKLQGWQVGICVCVCVEMWEFVHVCLSSVFFGLINNKGFAEWLNPWPFIWKIPWNLWQPIPAVPPHHNSSHTHTHTHPTAVWIPPPPLCLVCQTAVVSECVTLQVTSAPASHTHARSLTKPHWKVFLTSLLYMHTPPQSSVA